MDCLFPLSRVCLSERAKWLDRRERADPIPSSFDRHSGHGGKKRKGKEGVEWRGEDECSAVQSLWEFDFRLRGCALSEVELGRIPHQAGSRGENNWQILVGSPIINFRRSSDRLSWYGVHKTGFHDLLKPPIFFVLLLYMTDLQPPR